MSKRVLSMFETALSANPSSSLSKKQREGREQFIASQLLTPEDKRRLERLRAPGAAQSSTGPNLLLFEIENFFVFANLYGDEVVHRVLELAEQEISTLCEEFLPGCPLSITRRIDGQRFLFIFDADTSATTLPDLAFSFRLKLKSTLKREAIKLTGQELDVSAGYAPIQLSGGTGVTLEHAIYEALCDAQRTARGLLNAEQLSLLREFRAILADRRMKSVFQPIVDFKNGGIMGWEALTRGPADSYFHSPAVIFDFAEETDQVFALERTCRENAISGAGKLAPGQKLFINIHPRTLVDPEFSPGETRMLLERYSINPEDVVLEITERHSVRDFTLFHRTLEHYRSQGYQVAVDDVGAGYSGLWSIAEIRPEFIKIDMNLVRSIDTDPVKRALMETFVGFADKIGCELISEGVETENELKALVDMGVHYGQGFYLARPAAPKPREIRKPPLEMSSAAREKIDAIKTSMPVGELVEQIDHVPPSAKVGHVRELIHTNDSISAIVVTRGARPVGLIMGHHLDRALSSRYGVSLYYDRDVTHVMDADPLMVDASAPVEAVARKAMNREKFKIYDHVIVTNGGHLAGVITVQRLLDALASVQVEMAKGANPLTGLPGNVAIELKLEEKCRGKGDFSIIYADLDNFKVYNDVYGFHSGDAVIQLIAKVLMWSVKRHGDPAFDFVGHVGGDDFVIVTHPDRVERICKAIIRVFGRSAPRLYTDEDRERGYISAKDRAGKEADFPLVSVSLAIVDCKGGSDLAAIIHRSAEMKKFAKSKPGNSFARDRRGPVSPDAMADDDASAGDDASGDNADDRDGAAKVETAWASAPNAADAAEGVENAPLDADTLEKTR